MPTPIYPSWNDKEFDLLKKMTENTALIADYEIGDVASVAGTANQVLVNGGTAAATGNITLSLPSLISGISRISTTGTTTGVTDLLINPTTKASGNLIDAQVNSVSKFSVTSAGAGTFGGNLTVSGTGTSSVSGRLQTGVGVANSAFQLLNSTSGSGASDGLALELTGANAYFVNYENGPMYWFGGAAGANQLMSLSATGNLTVSGTTGVTATDLTLGTSGPSVKSTLSARAPRQGLVFDGTAKIPFSLAAFGTNPATIHFWFNPATFSGNPRLIGASSAIQLLLDASGAQFYTAGGSVYGSALTVGKTTAITVVINGNGTAVVYTNGVAGTSGNITANLSTAIDTLGGLASGNIFSGVMSPLIYNRALSASEVVALYEAGAPAGADYNSASNTAINTSAWANYSNPTYAYQSFTSASATGFTASNSTNPASGLSVAVMAPQVTTFRSGTRYLVTFSATLTSGEAPKLRIGDSAGKSNEHTVTAGSNSVVLTTTSSVTATENIIFFNTLATSFSVSSVSVTRLGLLLAPDAAQAGGGLVWYDTSGNAANITLPASGVSWNVPSSRVLGGNWTTSGNLTVSGTGETAIAGYLRVGSNTGGALTNGSFNVGALSDNVTLRGVYQSATLGRYEIAGADGNAAAFKPLALEGSTLVLNGRATGNVLVGGLVDSTNGNLQLKDTSGSSTKGIGFGADTSLYRWQAGGLALDHIGASNPYFSFRANGTENGSLQASGGDFYITAMANKTMYLRTNGGTTALTLASNQSATFASNVTANGDIVTAINYVFKSLGDAYLDSASTKSIFLRPAGTTALTLDSSQNATFAGRIGLTASGTNTIYSNFIPAATGTYAGSITMQAGGGSSAYGGGLQLYGHSHASKPGWVSANISQGSSGKFAVNNSGLGGGTDVLTVDTGGNATFAGAIAIGNTVNTAAGVASTHKVTISIGGSTYYLLATNV